MSKKGMTTMDSLKMELIEFQEKVKENFPYNQYQVINEAVGELRNYYLEDGGKKYLAFEYAGSTSEPIKNKNSSRAKLGFVLGRYLQNFENKIKWYMESVSYSEDLHYLIYELAEIIERYL